MFTEGSDASRAECYCESDKLSECDSNLLESSARPMLNLFFSSLQEKQMKPF